jgi:hypothetical protein
VLLNFAAFALKTLLLLCVNVTMCVRVCDLWTLHSRLSRGRGRESMSNILDQPGVHRSQDEELEIQPFFSPTHFAFLALEICVMVYVLKY